MPHAFELQLFIVRFAHYLKKKLQLHCTSKEICNFQYYYVVEKELVRWLLVPCCVFTQQPQ